MPRLPDPAERHPLVLASGERHKATVFLKNVIDHPNIEVGDYTYYDDRTMPEDYAARIAPYTFAGVPEKLIIGKFCQIAQGAQFITATANHPMDGVSTYPFGVFDPERFAGYRDALAAGGDLIVGHDCWIGREATLLPSARLGCGVIVGAKAVVAGAVPDYAVVAGNPATIIRMRFSETEIAALMALAWWDWPPAKIAEALEALEHGGLAALSAVAGHGA